MALVQNTGKGMVDGRDRERIANYTKFWDKDISKEDSTHTENRVDSYTDVVNGVYFFPFRLRILLSVANDYPSFLGQAITTARPSCTSTAGPTRSTSAASTRARRSLRRSPATSTTSRRKCGYARGCACSTSGAASAAPRAR